MIKNLQSENTSLICQNIHLIYNYNSHHLVGEGRQRTEGGGWVDVDFHLTLYHVNACSTMLQLMQKMIISIIDFNILKIKIALEL